MEKKTELKMVVKEEKGKERKLLEFKTMIRGEFVQVSFVHIIMTYLDD